MNSKFKVIHVFDDDKFIDSAIKLIESVHPNKSRYFVVQSARLPFIYVKSNKAESLIIQCNDDEQKFVDYIHECNIEVVFFHALNLTKQRLVNAIDKRVVKVWFIWGYDLYTNWQLFKKHIYEKETFHFLNANKNLKVFKNKLIFNNISFWLFSSFNYKKLLLPKKMNRILDNNYSTDFYNAIQKIDIVVPVVPTEYDLVKKIKINPVYAPFSYDCLENILRDKIIEDVLQSNNILIGNSADPSNNHIEAFKKIAKFDLNDRKVIVPLSYGGSKAYIDFVIEKGNYYFGENFVPLINFMTLQEYNQLISSCGFVIFNHIRQQAVGNIITLGYMGAKLFLNEKSPVFAYYKNLGMNIFTTNNILSAAINENLDVDKYNANKKIFIENYSERAVKEKIGKLFSIVNDELLKKNKLKST